MQCDLCGRINGHAYGCPYYSQPKSAHYCSICDNGVLDGEEYIVNDSGDYAHWDCVDYARDLAKFLGYDIKEMEDEDE